MTGRVYNNLNRPPYPNGKNTQSGIKTHSTGGGGSDNFNEIRFDDKKGSEEVYLRAERNHTLFVKADRKVTVGGGETVEIGKKRSTAVHEDDELTVEGRHEMASRRAYCLRQGDRHSKNTVMAEADTIAINGPARVTLSSDVEVTLKVGGSSIVVTKDGIELNAGTVKITGQTETDLAGGGATAKLHGAVDVCGTTINMNG